MQTSPNVLLVVTDQQRADLVGAAGRVPVRTPTADRLCREGTMFTRAYAATPICTPSRATLLSGQYPSRHGAWNVGVETPADVLSLPRLLAEQAGYRTAIIGKSHLRPCLRNSVEAPPASQDWDYFRSWSGPWYGFEHARISVGHTYEPHGYSMHYGLWLNERGIPLRPPYFMTREEAEEALGVHAVPPALPADERIPAFAWALPEEHHPSAWVAEETISYLREHTRSQPGRPFYVSVNFPDPHYPLVAPTPWDRMYEEVALPQPARRHGEWVDKPSLYQATIGNRLAESGWHSVFPVIGQRAMVTPTESLTAMEERWWRSYMGMQSLLDHHLGRIIDELDVLGISEDTLVILTSDHGDYMGDHFLWCKGGSHYDGAVRVPLIVRWPGRVPAGVTNSTLQSLVDLAPTVLRAAGLDIHPLMQGVDQTPAWADPDAAARPGVLIEHRLESGLSVHTWITDRYRLSLHSDLAHDRSEPELYDLQEDPQELTSVAADPDRKDLVRELLAATWRHRLEVSGPWPERVSPA